MRFGRLVFIAFILPLAFLSGAYLRSLENQATESFSAQVATGILEAPPADRPKEKEYELLFVGDIMLSRGVEYYIQKVGGGDYRYPFAKISDELRAADLLVGNLENPISSRGKNQGSAYSFRANPKALDGLSFAGFDVLSLANNHMWDYGTEALEDTVGFLGEWGMKGVGAGGNYAEANSPVFAELPDGTRIAFFSFTNLMPRSLEATETRPGLSQFEPELIKERIFGVQNQADIVVVLPHWGEEYETSANEFQKRFARELVNAGADLVVGHHPHVVQEVELWKQGWIAYSLGNFVFDQRFSDDTKQGLILRVKVQDRKIASVEKVKIAFTETFQPEVVD